VNNDHNDHNLLGTFLPVLNPVVIPGLRVGISAVLRGSLYVMYYPMYLVSDSRAGLKTTIIIVIIITIDLSILA